MDPLPALLLDKGNNSKPKIRPRVNQATKMITGEPQRQNRVFGTARSTNIPAKYVSDLTITKTKIVVPRRKPNSIRVNQPPFDTSTKVETTDKKSPENANPIRNMYSDIFPQRVVEKPISKNSQLEKDYSEEPKTPVVRTTKSKVSVTPSYTAAHCSKCRFDKFETSYYWVGQIKMAESVGKHFVASAFFRLALESQAEPIRELGMELKRYLLRGEDPLQYWRCNFLSSTGEDLHCLLRHGYLSKLQEWKEVAARYGLLKVGSNPCGTDSST